MNINPLEKIKLGQKGMTKIAYKKLLPNYVNVKLNKKLFLSNNILYVKSFLKHENVLSSKGGYVLYLVMVKLFLHVIYLS